VAGKGNDGLRLVDPKCGRKKGLAAIFAENLGLGKVLSVLCKEERGNNVAKEIVKPVGHVLRLIEPH
jgi:hypothetical protein